MTEKEYADQIELLNKSLDESRAAAAAKDKEVGDLKAQLEASQKSAPKAEDLKALQEKASQAEAHEKTIAGLKGQMVLMEIKSEFPDVDVALLTPGASEAMKAQAKQLQAMVESALRKWRKDAPAPKDGEPNPPKTPWDGVPGMGSPKPLDTAEREKVEKDIATAMGNNDTKGVLEGCFKRNPVGAGLLLAGKK